MTNYIVFSGCIAVGVGYLLAAIASAVVSMCTAYLLHRTITFNVAKQASVREFLEFMGVFLLQLTLGILDYIVLIGHFGMNTSLAFLINGGLMALMSFSILRGFTFRTDRHL